VGVLRGGGAAPEANIRSVRRHGMNYDQAVGAAIVRFDLEPAEAQGFVLALAHNDGDTAAKQYGIDEGRARRFKSRLDLARGGFA